MATRKSNPPIPRAKKRAGRPPLPEGTARVVLTAQRVRPETLAYLAKHPDGIGQAIDAAVDAAQVHEKAAGS